MSNVPCEAAWRRMTLGDLDAVMRLAEAIHPDLPEPPETFADRISIWPQGALLLERQGEACGYAIAHPIRLHEPPKLGSIIGSLPANADALYLHDMAITATERGRGHVGRALDLLFGEAKDYPVACLIAVYGTPVFWRRHGFVPTTGMVAPKKLAPYGSDAIFMIRELH